MDVLGLADGTAETVVTGVTRMNSIRETDVQKLTLDVFKPLVGKRFLALGMEADLTLDEAKALNHGVRDGGSFSLVFVAPDGTGIGQGMLQLTCDGQDFDLFLVPIGPFGDGQGLEAVFT